MNIELEDISFPVNQCREVWSVVNQSQSDQQKLGFLLKDKYDKNLGLPSVVEDHSTHVQPSVVQDHSAHQQRSSNNESKGQQLKNYLQFVMPRIGLSKPYTLLNLNKNLKQMNPAKHKKTYKFLRVQGIKMIIKQAKDSLKKPYIRALNILISQIIMKNVRNLK